MSKKVLDQIRLRALGEIHDCSVTVGAMAPGDSDAQLLPILLE